MGERLSDIARRNAQAFNADKPMKYTATVVREREITVEAETPERADKLLKRRLEPKEIIIAVQTSQL